MNTTPNETSCPDNNPVELSVVMPCLNEVRTLGDCIAKALGAIESMGLVAEVVIADNGSTDGSIEAAEAAGARVVRVTDKGYGSALRGGIEASRGRFVLFADADMSYDFGAIEPFVTKLRAGAGLVMGNRFAGKIMPGAMPFKHKWFGNPVLSAIGRVFFHSPARDFHCGLRAFTREVYDQLDLHTTGMEFASEMVVKATLMKVRIEEVPITLHPDGRDRPPHLRSWRDGWRHLRFMLLFSPLYLFMIPGLALLGLGLLVMILLAAGGREFAGFGLDIHTMLMAGLACVLGYQLIIFAVFTKVFAITEGLHPPAPQMGRVFHYVRLETGLIAGTLLVCCALAMIGWATWGWASEGFGSLDPRITMRQLIPAAVLLMIGSQTVFASFFLSILGLKRR